MECSELRPNHADFELLTVIGNGCNGSCTVSVAEHKPTKSHVAIKRVNVESPHVDLSLLQHEVRQHKLLSHPNILPTHCTFVHNNEVWIVSPLAGFGSSLDLIHAHFHNGLPELAIAYILRDVLQALEYLHRRGVIHRSVKASHMLVSASGRVMLSGFRHSHNTVDVGKRARSIYEFPTNYISSLLWASPELLEQNMGGYTTKSDLYSVGIAACEMANGVAPFSDVPSTQMLLEKIQGVQPILIDSNTITESAEYSASEQENSLYQRTFSNHFHNFVQICLQSDPNLRPPASSLLQHAFFKQIRRKSHTDLLPCLLQPVQPLMSVELPKTPDIDGLADELAQVDMEQDQWSF